MCMPLLKNKAWSWSNKEDEAIRKKKQKLEKFLLCTLETYNVYHLAIYTSSASYNQKG
jgi:hypothetical protein